jgi:hypothetical protein
MARSARPLATARPRHAPPHASLRQLWLANPAVLPATARLGSTVCGASANASLPKVNSAPAGPQSAHPTVAPGTQRSAPLSESMTIAARTPTAASRTPYATCALIRACSNQDSELVPTVSSAPQEIALEVSRVGGSCTTGSDCDAGLFCGVNLLDQAADAGWNLPPACNSPSVCMSEHGGFCNSGLPGDANCTSYQCNAGTCRVNTAGGTCQVNSDCPSGSPTCTFAFATDGTGTCT